MTTENEQITPADAANKKVDWTIAFKNASSTWATGKTVTEYATVTPSADGALTAVVALGYILLGLLSFLRQSYWFRYQ